MARRITARIYIRNAETGEIVSASEVTANSKLRCKKFLNTHASDLQYYKNHPEKYTVSAFAFKKEA